MGMMNTAPTQSAATPFPFKPILWSAAIAIFFFAMAAYEYSDLTEWEADGGTRMMNSMTRILYDIGGKWGVAGSSIAIGLYFVWMVIQHVRSFKASSRT